MGGGRDRAAAGAVPVHRLRHGRTDGRRESLVAVWRWVIPLALCSVVAVVNAFLVGDWGLLEWAVAAVACLPTLLILVRRFR
jgi:hypothetical protein